MHTDILFTPACTPFTKVAPVFKQPDAGWWYKPDFIINDLNINSAISRPWHDEVIPLGTNTPYIMRGYAYGGGGRKIIRVEVSLDGGLSWKLAEIRRFEKPNPHGGFLSTSKNRSVGSDNLRLMLMGHVNACAMRSSSQRSSVY